MTFNRTQASGFRRFTFAAATCLLAGALVAGCSGSKEEQAVAKAEKQKAAKTEPAAPPTSAADKQSRLASAVVDGKTTAPVDMKYDVLARPDVGQPFEVELSFEARLPADALEVEIYEAPGLILVGEKAGRFAPVEGGQSYVTKVLVKGDNPGLFYLGVMAKMSTKVQTESRAFAVPIVIGNAPVAQKSAPAKDASGQPIQSLPAEEPK